MAGTINSNGGGTAPQDPARISKEPDGHVAPSDELGGSGRRSAPVGEERVHGLRPPAEAASNRTRRDASDVHRGGDGDDSSDAGGLAAPEGRPDEDTEPPGSTT